MQEEWKDIPKLEGKYQVSNLGRVRQLEHTVTYKTGRQVHKEYKIVEQKDYNGEGYRYVSIPYYRMPPVHKLVAQAFVLNKDNLTHIDHIDDNPSNNRADNLQWVTREQNARKFVSNHKNYNRAKPCKCINNGAVYPSQSAAQKDLQLYEDAVKRSILGNRSINGYTFISITEEEYERLREK